MIFAVAVFDEVWLIFLGINVSLKEGFLDVVQFVLKFHIKRLTLL